MELNEERANNFHIWSWWLELIKEITDKFHTIKFTHHSLSNANFSPFSSRRCSWFLHPGGHDSVPEAGSPNLFSNMLSAITETSNIISGATRPINY